MSNFQTESSCVLDTGTKKVWNFYTIEFTGIELYGLIVCAISKKGFLKYIGSLLQFQVLFLPLPGMFA